MHANTRGSGLELGLFLPSIPLRSVIRLELPSFSSIVIVGLVPSSSIGLGLVKGSTFGAITSGLSRAWVMLCGSLSHEVSVTLGVVLGGCLELMLFELSILSSPVEFVVAGLGFGTITGGSSCAWAASGGSL